MNAMDLTAGRTDERGLATDLYQLTMAAAYHASGRCERASFELFIRRLPSSRSYLVVAGLERALDYLEHFRFSEGEIDYLHGLPVFRQVDANFFDYLRALRFTGDVWAIPEGTLAFAGEPLLRITAPLIEAQIVETFLLSTLNFQTMIASKAARVVEAAQGRGVVEFGARRAHSMGAAFYGARAAFIGGCIGTSNLEAGRAFDLPVYGTSAHSFIMAFENELDAFRAYFRVFPESTTLLLDTYDTVEAARLATEFGPILQAVRLDSGDLGGLAREVRSILDCAGMNKTRIMASGDLNEARIVELVEAGAPIDFFGVGTEISTSFDAPALGGIYKLVELEVNGRREPKMKLSGDKATYPYRKQVWRAIADDDTFIGDLIALDDEDLTSEGYEPLLELVMRDGVRVAPLPDLRASKERARTQLARLPVAHRLLKGASPFPVRYSDALERGRRTLGESLERRSSEEE